MTSLVLTLTETLRYRGAVGQWSWVLHRVTGLGVLFFFILHVIDTSWSAFFPGKYEEAIAIYQTPLFTMGEFALIGAVVYHALNGLRIVIFDYRPQWWRYQQQAAVYVLLVTVVILILTYMVMFGAFLRHINSNPTFLPLDQVLLSQLPFGAGMIIAAAVALVLSFVYGLIRPEANVVTRRTPSRTERFWWQFMRISGVLILPLVFGHLAMMHVLQGVFDITGANLPVTGTGMINSSGLATEFVFHRWSTAIAGVYVWRIYDIALLGLCALHGFNGLRYVFTDYARQPTIRRALVILCIIGVIAMLLTGGAALLMGVPETAIEMAAEAVANAAH